jgi:hypothetical protein
VSERRSESFVINESNALTFSAFVLGLASTTLIHLGVTNNPETGRSSTDMVLARQSIDVLLLLREKTVGNLTADEEQLFKSVLTDLQMRFVALSSSSQR